MKTIPTSINSTLFPSSALTALAVLEDAGFEGWFVGGCVRDAFLGRQAHDVDITTSAHWSDVERVFNNAGYDVHRTGVKHGTVTVIVNRDAFEITTYRIDGDYADGRHPSEVTFSTILEEDLSRRDFTINAMAYHPKRGLRDPFEGRLDLERGIIRAVGKPRARFREDALRILRACRFMSQLGFTIEHDTFLGMLEYKSLMVNLSAERVVYELDRLLLGDHVHDALMASVDILGPIIPELVACKNFKQNTPYHVYDVLEHTAYVVQNSCPRRLNRWAALFHDIGKPPTYFHRDDGIGHFYGHPMVSVIIAEGTMRRLKMAPSFIEQVLTLVKIHDDLIDDNSRAVKRALARLGGNTNLFTALCDLKRADALSQAPQCYGRVELAESLARKMEEIVASDDAYSLKQLAIDGKDVMTLGIEAGPRVGEILQSALDAVIDGAIPNDRTSLIAYLEERI